MDKSGGIIYGDRSRISGLPPKEGFKRPHIKRDESPSLRREGKGEGVGDFKHLQPPPPAPHAKGGEASALFWPHLSQLLHLGNGPSPPPEFAGA